MNSTTPDFIPENTAGKSVDLVHEVTEASVQKAKLVYNSACSRLLDPQVWPTISGFEKAVFVLLSSGNEAGAPPIREGDFVKIDVPGPGSNAGEGYDWVQATALESGIVDDADESIGLILQPTKNPENAADGTAHFFKEGASSVFVIERRDATVRAHYYGRNELPNIKEAGFMDAIRNSLVAIGALAGLSNVLWNALLKGLLEEGDGRVKN